MENFLSKFFSSKNKKQVYNVDKSKKQNLKKANKDMNQLSSTYFTNKLRKEFGIYKPKSEFSTTKYNMPCVVQNREYSIESVDIIPQSFQEEQKLDLVKCTQEQKPGNRTLLFDSDMEPESINKEFGIDENEGCDRQSPKIVTNDLRRINPEKVEVHQLETLQKTDKCRYIEGKDQEETSNTSLTAMDLEKDSLYGRYEDACVKLNSYKCNKEFIFESKKEHEVESKNSIQTVVSKRHDNGQERKVSVVHETPICSSFSEQNNGDTKIGKNIDMGTVAEINDFNKFLITKKGRIKCKSPDKEKTKKSNSAKDDDGLSRHRYYHSMIILGGKKKTKSTHSKNIKITNTQILEVTQKKFGSEIPKSNNETSLDNIHCDDKRLNFMQNNSSTVRTMCYRNANNKLCAVNIPPSEHTLKWLDENFGPGSRNTLNNSDETDFSDPSEDLIIKRDHTFFANCTKIAMESEREEATLNNLIKAEDNSVLGDHANKCTTDENVEIETAQQTDKMQLGDSNDNQRKTVRVVSFKKSRTLKSNTNSCESILDNTDLHTEDENEKHVDIQSPGISVNMPNNEILKVFGSSNRESTEAHEKYDLKTEILDDCKIPVYYEADNCTYQKVLDKKEELKNSIILTEEDHSPTKKDPLLDDPSLYPDTNVHVAQNSQSKENMESTKKIYSSKKEPTIKDYTTNLKLQNENIFGILRDQEKRTLAKKNEKTKTFQENKEVYEDPLHKCDVSQRPLEDKIVLKLNDKILHVDDHIESDIIKRQDHKGLTKKYSKEEIKRRHEELEKDYIMTRLELALNTEVIEKPEMAKYILEKSQEVMKDVVEKTNESITKKLLTQNNVDVEAEGTVSPFHNDFMTKCKDNATNTEKNTNQITINNAIGETKNNCDNKEKIVKDGEKQNPSANFETKQEYPSQNITKNDLNNISKIQNVKIYRKESKKTTGEKYVKPISINSIDNIMKNKTLLLDEIKSLKRKK